MAELKYKQQSPMVKGTYTAPTPNKSEFKPSAATTPQQTTTPTQTNSSSYTQYNPYANTQTSNPYTQQTDQIINQLLTYGQNQGNFDPYSSSQYKAAEAQAQRSNQANTRAAQEAYGSAGFGRSYALGERAQGIANDSTNYLMTQVLPQVEAQEQARRQQEYNNILSALSPLMNQQSRADGLVQQDFNNNLAVSDRTGYYKPQGADELINNLLNLKRQAETQGVTAEERSRLSGEADVIRSMLQGMGVGTDTLGANVNLANASANPYAGMRTLSGQQMDLQNKQANLDAALSVGAQTGKAVTPQNDWTGLYRQDAPNNLAGQQFAANEDQRAQDNAYRDKTFTYTAGRDAVADQQWLDQFDQQVKQNGLQNALAWAAQTLNQQQVNNSAGNQAFQQQMAIWEATGQAPAGIAGVAVGTPYSAGAAAAAAKQQSTFTSTQVYNSVTSQYKDLFDGTKTPTTSDWENVYKSVINFGLPESEEYDILRGIGMSAEQIADFDKRLLNSNSGN